ncbi:MAG: hypothetical protein ACOC05_03445 [Oceanicaulis sp.]
MTVRADTADQTAGAGIGPAGDGTSGYGSGQGSARITLGVLLALTIVALVWILWPSEQRAAPGGELVSAEEAFESRGYRESLSNARNSRGAAPQTETPAADGEAAAEGGEAAAAGEEADVEDPAPGTD